MNSQMYLDQIFAQVCGTAYVKHNPIYNHHAQNTKINSNNSTVVNAYATMMDLDHSKIVIYDGLVMAASLVGAILADYSRTKNLATLRDRFRKAAPTLAKNSSKETVLTLIGEFGLNLEDAVFMDSLETYAYYGVAAVVAHELGHIVLGHCAANDWTEVLSRNNERQADLFAAQIIEVFPAKSYGIYANMFIEVLFLWMSPSNYEPSTHPHSRERVYNMYDSHDVYFRAFGLVRAYLDLFLPNPDEYDVSIEDLDSVEIDEIEEGA